MRALVILPTYNERKNITAILDGILAHKNIDVLVVDDNSPDGTQYAVRKHKHFGKRITLLTGEKQGLGAAYKRGFEHALTTDADIFIEMDADGSHDPQDLPLLIAETKTADFVIGSRYISGGRTTGWGAHRKLLSWGGNMVARILAGLWKTKDCTAGFRAITREVAETIDWEAMPAKGYGFQIELLWHAKRHGSRISELPVTFADRTHGSSKLGLADIFEFGLIALRLGLRTYMRLIRFLLVGASGFIVNWGVFALLFLFTPVPVWLLIALATEASILSNFFLNNIWTFRDRRETSFAGRITRYHYTALGGLLITYFTYYALTTTVSWHALVVYPVAIGAATAWNFSMSYLWAWKKEKKRKK